MSGLGGVARLAFLLALVSFFLGCAPQDKQIETKKRRRVPADQVYDQASCAFASDAGKSAIFSNLNRTQIRVSEYFGKAYDHADFEAVYQASAESTADYVKQLGVRLYKVPRTAPDRDGKKLCQMYHFLPEPNEDLLQFWDYIAGGDHGEGSLAGLYFEDCSIATCPERSLKDPTVMVDEGSDRWTLVHEMMHHNFNKTRKGDATKKSRRALDYEHNYYSSRTEDLINKYRNSPNENDLREIAKEIRNLTVITYDLLVRSSLEEIAIEMMMIDAAYSGDLGYVTPQSGYSAAWYIQHSRSMSLQRLESIDQRLIAYVETEAKERGYPSVSQENRPSKDLILSVRQEMDELVEKSCTRSHSPHCRTATSAGLAKIDAAMVAMTHPHIEHVDKQAGMLKADQRMDRLLNNLGL